jgi:hypothetical protein
LLDSLNTQVKAQTANQYGYSPYQAVGSLPAQEQDAILGDMANQITFKGGISVSANDLKGLPTFRPPTFMDSIGNIGQNIGKGIIPERNAYPQEKPLDGWGTFGNAFTQSATGGIVDTKEGDNFWADFGGNLAGMGTSIGAGAGVGALVGGPVGAGVGALIAGGLGAFGNTLRGYEDRGKPLDGTAFADATLQGGLAVVPVFGKAGQIIGKVAPKLTGKLASSALGRLANTGAGKIVGNTLLEGAENVVGEAGSQALRNEYDPRALALSGALGAGAGAGLHLSSKAIGKLAGKRAKITEAPSQKQAVEALQNEAKNAPLASQRNRARAVLRRMNTEQSFNALEAPQPKQANKKPVVVVPIKKKIKPPLQLPTKVVGGFKKKVTPAEVAKPANVEAPTTKESLTVEPKPQETAVEAKVVEPTPAKVEKVPERPDGMTHKEHLDYLNKKAPAGFAYESQAYDKGYLVLYEKTSHVEAKVIAEKALFDKPISQVSDAELIKKAEKRASEVETDSLDPVNVAKNNILLKELDNRRFNAEGDTPELDKAHEALTLATSHRATKSGKEISGLETKTSVERATEVLREYSKESPAKLKAEAEAVKAEAKTVTEEELKAPKSINKGSRDIDTQLQELKASQGTQPQTPDDIRRGAGVLMGHDSFLAKETLEALGYPLKYKKFSDNANSTGWSVLIGGKKVELYPSDSLGGLLRRNKLEVAFEAGLVKRKAGDVVKGLIDDLDPNDLTLNETDLKQKLTAYGDGLPQDGNLITSREDEAFTLLDNAKTPDELNAVEAYVSERENDYQEGFHEEFYKHWDDRHKALEGDYQGKVDKRIAKADETRQLKATEELKVLKKQLEAETNKVLKLENEMALLSPTVRLERTLQNDVLRDAKKVAKRLKGGIESGKIDDAQFTRIVEGLSPEAREALAEEFSC